MADFRNLVAGSRLGAFPFLVVVADPARVGLLAFLAELSSHLFHLL